MADAPRPGPRSESPPPSGPPPAPEAPAAMHSDSAAAKELREIKNIIKWLVVAGFAALCVWFIILKPMNDQEAAKCRAAKEVAEEFNFSGSYDPDDYDC